MVTWYRSKRDYTRAAKESKLSEYQRTKLFDFWKILLWTPVVPSKLFVSSK